MSRIIRLIFGIAPAVLSVFFVFYTARLLYVTHGLTAGRRANVFLVARAIAARPS